jgi:hypothetical protein
MKLDLSSDFIVLADNVMPQVETIGRDKNREILKVRTREFRALRKVLALHPIP